MEKKQVRIELLAGLTVALALIPEAVAFAFVAGVEPLVGLYAAFIVGLITSIFGGRPGMISGATGALAVVMVALVADHGVQYLFATVVLMGLIQISAGLLKLGRFIRLVPHPVMLGFVNGLAIVIGLAQLEQFKAIGADGHHHWLTPPQLALMAILIVVTMAIMHFLPRLTKAVPAALVAIAAVTIANLVFDLNARTVIDTVNDMGAGGIAGGLPTFGIPSVPFTMETLRIILPYSVILAAIGLIESLMTLTLVDEITETRGDGNRECLGQGAANILTGFFGGMGGCAMIGQSMINISSGARHRLSGLSASIFLLLFILVGAPLIEIIPIGALVGVMFMVVIGTFEWSSVRLFNKVPPSDMFVVVLVSAITVVADLAIAVGVGVVVSALVFVWQKSSRIKVTSETAPDGDKVYHVVGALFFGSDQQFRDSFTPADDPEDITVNFRYAQVFGHSGIEALNGLSERYARVGKKVHLANLSEDCAQLLDKAVDIVSVASIDDKKHRDLANATS